MRPSHRVVLTGQCILRFNFPGRNNAF